MAAARRRREEVEVEERTRNFEPVRLPGDWPPHLEVSYFTGVIYTAL